MSDATAKNPGKFRGLAGWAAALVMAASAGWLALRPAATAPPPAAAVVPAGLVADADLDHADNGTDNGPAIQGAVNAALAAGTPVELPPGRYAVRSTISISPAVNFSFGGTRAGRGGPDDVTRGTWLVWAGPPGGTLLALQGIKCELHDFGMTCCRDTALDTGIDVETPPSYPNVSSQHLFSNLVAYGLDGTFKRGWLVGADGQANNEFHWWRSCTTRYMTYAGINIVSGNYQSKNHVCEDCSFGGNGRHQDYGIAVATGSLSCWRCNFDALGWGLKWFGGAYEPVQLLNCTGEDCLHYLDAGGCQYVDMQGCRLNLSAAANPQVPGDEFLRGGSNWSVRACAFEDGVDHFWRPNNGGTVTVESCAFHGNDPLASDAVSGWRGHFASVRVQGQNNLVHSGPWYRNNSPGLSYAGQSMVLGDGSWPMPGTFNAGTYTCGPKELRLFNDGNGNLMLQKGSNAPQQVQLQQAP